MRANNPRVRLEIRGANLAFCAHLAFCVAHLDLSSEVRIELWVDANIANPSDTAPEILTVNGETALLGVYSVASIAARLDDSLSARPRLTAKLKRRFTRFSKSTETS